jgi:phosphoglycolate phosphatase
MPTPCIIPFMLYRCLFFDLDGTLVDSRADLANSINLMLTDLRLEPLHYDRVVSFVGEGVPMLVQRALEASLERDTNGSEVETGIKLFGEHYRRHLLDETVVYPGVIETLESLKTLPMAVITNKSVEFTNAILSGLNLSRYFDVVLGGDSLPERKPSGVPLLEAARRCGVAPEECLMIGDSRVDIAAGKAAGIVTCGFTGGFRGRSELQEAGADYLIDAWPQLISIVTPAR